MKPKFLIITCFLFHSYVFCQEQQVLIRYVDRIFDTIKINPDIHYSTAPALNNNLVGLAAAFGYTVPDFNIHQGEGKTISQDLFMDIYMPPEDDTVVKRPAVVFIHGGAFLLGSRYNEDMVAFCDSFAHLGYVTASIDYRLGMGSTLTITGSLLDPQVSVTVDEENAIRAVYRSVQDANAAMNYLRANAGLYGIDPGKIFMLGSSAGAFTAMHNVYFDKDSEIPAAAKGYDDGPDLGSLDEYCQTDHPWVNNAMVSCWGAIQSSVLIEDDNTPVFLVHGTADSIVPFYKDKPLKGLIDTIPGISLQVNLPEVYGSYCIDTALVNRGVIHETYFVEGAGHQFYGLGNGSGPNAYWDTVYAMTRDFFYEQIVRIPSVYMLTAVAGNNGSIDPGAAFVNPGSDHTFTIFPDAGYTIATATYNGTDVLSSLIQSGNYFTFTAYDVAEDGVLEVTFMYVSSLTNNQQYKIKVYPNPANDNIFIEVDDPETFSLVIVDLNGRIVYEKALSGKSSCLDLENIMNGLYTLKLTSAERTYTCKLIIAGR
ncbi:MAG: T9SS type A sorting domain-containing protein [Bacteroidales bacterium]|nr:T9SS type A sorting domain-containing protein [Bacteroidales bacterium]